MADCDGAIETNRQSLYGTSEGRWSGSVTRDHRFLSTCKQQGQRLRPAANPTCLSPDRQTGEGVGKCEGDATSMFPTLAEFP